MARRVLARVEGKLFPSDASEQAIPSDEQYVSVALLDRVNVSGPAISDDALATQALVNRFRAGDETALETVYRRIRETGSSLGAAAPMFPFAEMNRLMGFM